jgi:hypothetical protein
MMHDHTCIPVERLKQDAAGVSYVCRYETPHLGQDIDSNDRPFCDILRQCLGIGTETDTYRYRDRLTRTDTGTVAPVTRLYVTVQDIVDTEVTNAFCVRDWSLPSVK